MSTLGSQGAPSQQTLNSPGEGGALDLGEVSTTLPISFAARSSSRMGSRCPPQTRLMLTRKFAWDQQLAMLDKQGRFTLPGVPGEQVSLNISVPGYHTSAKIPNLDMWDRNSLIGEIRGDVADLRILLEPGGRLAPGYEDFESPSTEKMEAAARQPFRNAP